MDKCATGWISVNGVIQAMLNRTKIHVSGDTNLSENDIARRNTIANLLQDWGLVKVVSESKVESAPLSQIKVISFKEKNEWKLETKYNIGKKKEE